MQQVKYSLPRLKSCFNCAKVKLVPSSLGLDSPFACFHRGVSTLTPLAQAFNTKSSALSKLNIVNEKSVGLFGIQELVTPDGFFALQEACNIQTESLINEACSSNRSRNVVQIFDDLSDELCRVADMAEFVRLGHPNGRYAQSAETVCINVSTLVEQLNTHLKLYSSLKHAVVNGDKFEESDVDKHVAKLFLFDFEQSGIHLSDTKRELCLDLNEKILHLGQHFQRGCHESRCVKRKLLPQHIQNYFSDSTESVELTGPYLDNSSSIGREASFKAYYWHDQHQEDLLHGILNSREKLAKLCDYKSFANRTLQSSLAETPEVVEDFLSSLSKELRLRADEDYKRLSVYKKKLEGSSSIDTWDVSYLSANLKRELIKINFDSLSEYFSLGVCMQGLSELFNRLFKITLNVESPQKGELWNDDVYKLGVVHETEGLLGHIYCDFFARRNKPNQDCHFTICGGRDRSDGTYQNPIVVLMLNFQSPGWTTPSLLSPAMVDNLFHEMGHAIHSMLARTKYQHVTGTRCSTDFAEVPSTLMEYFASDERVLKSFAKHYRTGEAVPDKVLKKYIASKNLFGAVDTQTQLFYASFDQRYHLGLGNKTSTEILADCQSQHHSLPYHEGTAWQLRFGHLVGYGARYYSYLVARAVASAIWHTYFKDNPFNTEMGLKYRSDCLSHGGGKPSKSLVSEYLGSEITPNLLANSVIQELDGKSSYIAQIVA